MLTIIMILGGIAILASVILLAFMFIKSNEVNLTGKTEDKPEWMKSNPPKETVKATRAEGEGVTLFNHDAGERIASPFAEQIEDILRAKLESDPFNKFDIDFGSAPDGSLEIWVNGSMYQSVNELPDEGLKNAFQNAVKEWERLR